MGSGRIEGWVAEAGLELSPTMSVAVLFSKGKPADIDQPGNLTVYRKELEYDSEARCLGVFIDRKLNFPFNIQKKIAAVPPFSRGWLRRLQSLQRLLCGRPRKFSSRSAL